MESIILASGSPRRQEYFKMLGIPFRIMPPRLDESYADGMPPDEFSRTMAVKKIDKILSQLNGKLPLWIFAADTIISFEGKVLGKSVTREEASETLKKLSGREHDIITSCALFSGEKNATDCRTVSTNIQFADIPPSTLEWYLDTGEWQGTAGSYKIQGIAGCFISKITGSFSSAVGLPLREFYLMLIENGYVYGR
ncbi:MAG: Maf family protein [Spirochaetaceae bacterium]|jgi:septum formation protein|nr:Maf family protein [Spirochaetaceae bacterium]